MRQKPLKADDTLAQRWHIVWHTAGTLFGTPLAQPQTLGTLLAPPWHAFGTEFLLCNSLVSKHAETTTYSPCSPLTFYIR